ncbi:MAG: hypothetical protein KatS3mg111_4395 [Pirellulaceae bacterium]|nr:MAG: hypothetical protein KatS3mg111_4395 [Pirellulaceae bacterium]
MKQRIQLARTVAVVSVALTISCTGCRSSGWKMPGAGLFSWNREPDAATLAGKSADSELALPEGPASKYTPNAIASTAAGSPTADAVAQATQEAASAYGYQPSGGPASATPPAMGTAAAANGYQTGPYKMASGPTGPNVNYGPNGAATMPSSVASAPPSYASSPMATSTNTSPTAPLPSPYGGTYPPTATTPGANGTAPAPANNSTADIPLPSSVTQALAPNTATPTVPPAPSAPGANTAVGGHAANGSLPSVAVPPVGASAAATGSHAALPASPTNIGVVGASGYGTPTVPSTTSPTGVASGLPPLPTTKTPDAASGAVPNVNASNQATATADVPHPGSTPHANGSPIAPATTPTYPAINSHPTSNASSVGLPPLPEGNLPKGYAPGTTGRATKYDFSGSGAGGGSQSSLPPNTATGGYPLLR